MKLTAVLYLFVSLFGAGAFFFRLNCHFKEQKFRLTLPQAAGSVWVSVLLSLAARMFHQQVLLLDEHLIFNALGSLFLAVMLSCGLALIRELRFFQSKTTAAGRTEPFTNPSRAAQQRNVLLFPRRNKSFCAGRKRGLAT